MSATEQPASVDVDDAARLIAEALSATGILLPMTRLEVLDRGLRAEATRLIRVVQRQADATPLRSREWYELIQAAERAEETLQFQLGTMPLAGSLQVAELARRVCELRDVAPNTEP
ncbi:DUF6415 family natural product biosynthesis protein [Streptomyces sp. NBUA17]|uniref:DUF6415 family natural product biosynthesis protein n=1 Tax=Streptomyces sp. NBUA17 TaxID=3062275 RepID=UPI0037DA3E3B